MKVAGFDEFQRPRIEGVDARATRDGVRVRASQFGLPFEAP